MCKRGSEGVIGGIWSSSEMAQHADPEQHKRGKCAQKTEPWGMLELRG